jgi:hypothetical protein
LSVIPQQAPKGAPKPKSNLVAAAFNEDSDSEPEEMPPEAKMRMKNIGRWDIIEHMVVSA